MSEKDMGQIEAEAKNNKEGNRRLKYAYIVIGLVTVAYYTDRFIGTYTGDWKVYAYVVGTVFAIGAGYFTVTHVLDRFFNKDK